MNFIRNFTLYKIFENSIPNIIHKKPEIKLGRWSRKNEDIKILYANMDHCGYYICGNPQILKYTYPKYFKK